MYKDFYKLQSRPFDIVPNPHIIYESKKHSQALTYLRYGFSENIGFVLFTGEIGAGKTTLLKHLLTKIDKSTEAAVVFNTNVDDEELLRLILIEFEIEGVGKDKSHNLDLLNTYLIDMYQLGKRCLLIIDEAQNLSIAALEEVRLLSNLQTDTEPLLQIILAGQPELRDIISGPGLEQLAQRVALYYHLAPLALNEVKEYINYRLESSGGHKSLFDESAIQLIYDSTAGVPRSINIIANAALVYGYADGLSTISKGTIQQVLDDKGVKFKSQSNVADFHRVKAIDLSLNSVDDQSLVARVAHLESQLSIVTGKIHFHTQQIEGAVNKGHQAVNKAIEKMLSQERDRSEKFQKKCILLAEQNKILQKQYQDLQDDFVQLKVKRKKGFFRF